MFNEDEEENKNEENYDYLKPVRAKDIRIVIANQIVVSQTTGKIYNISTFIHMFPYANQDGGMIVMQNIDKTSMQSRYYTTYKRLISNFIRAKNILAEQKGMTILTDTKFNHDDFQSLGI